MLNFGSFQRAKRPNLLNFRRWGCGPKSALKLGDDEKCQSSCPKNPKIEKSQDRPPGLKFSSEIVTFPALQKTFVDFFFEFAWELCIEKWRGFLVNLLWSPFPTT